MPVPYRPVGILTLAVLSAGCYDPNPTDPTPDMAGLSLDVQMEIAPADGETLVPVLVQVPNSARGDSRKVTLTTSLGSFEGSSTQPLTVVANAEERAIADLRAPSRTGWARVRSTVAGVIREDSIQFVAAAPSRIDVDAGKFTLAAGLKNEIVVKATLRRFPGKVTPGAAVSFTATRADNGQAIGQFSTAAPSDANGEVSVRYSAGETPYRGVVIITATHEASKTAGTTRLQIVD